MDSGLVFQLAFIIPIFYLLAGLVLFILLVRVLLILHTYLALKVQQERMRPPTSLDE